MNRLLAVDVIDAVAAAWGIAPADVTGRRKTQFVARARSAAALILRDEYEETLVRIGAALGRDHSTAINSIRTARVLRETDHDFATRLGWALDGLRAVEMDARRAA